MIITIEMYKLSATLMFCVGYKILFVYRMKVSKVQWVSCRVLILLYLHKTLWTLCNVWNIQELTCNFLNHNPNNVILCDLLIYEIICDLPSYAIGWTMWFSTMQVNSVPPFPFLFFLFFLRMEMLKIKCVGEVHAIFKWVWCDSMQFDHGNFKLFFSILGLEQFDQRLTSSNLPSKSLCIFFIVVVLWFEQGLWSLKLPFYPFLCISIMLCINVVYIVECCITKFKQNQMFLVTLKVFSKFQL